MKKELNKARIVSKISAPETLLALEVGVPSVIPASKITEGAVRVAASRLERKKKARFIVSTEGVVGGTKVIRLM